jgi:hypothetical protein
VYFELAELLHVPPWDIVTVPEAWREWTFAYFDIKRRAETVWRNNPGLQQAAMERTRRLQRGEGIPTGETALERLRREYANDGGESGAA